MNIIYYCDEYPPYKTGGIGSVTQIVAEELVRKGHHVFVVGYYPDGKKGIFCENINGVVVYRLNLGYRLGLIKHILFLTVYKLGLSHLYIQREVDFTEMFIQSLVEKHAVDLIEFPDYYDFTRYSKREVKFRKFSVPVVLRIHGSVSFMYHLQGEDKAWIKMNDQLHFQRCNQISAVSHYSLQYVCSNFTLDPVVDKKVVYNPVEDSFLCKSSPSDHKRILFIGKLIETKGCYSLLKAFNTVATESKYKDWELIMIGNGNQQQALSYVSTSVRNRVHFLGFCDRERIKKEIDSCAFACVPTYFENFSMVALEIMGRGKALIFTERTSGNEVIENGKDGLLVNPEDIPGISKSIKALIDDIQQRNFMADRAFQKVKNNFSVSAIIVKMEKLYNDLIDKFK